MKVIQISYQSTNCYLLSIENGWLMIDAGWPDSFSQLLQILNQHNICINEINYLIVTHYHPDHAGLTQNLKELGTTLILHEYQIPYINKLNQHYKKNAKINFKDINCNNSNIVNDFDSSDFLKSIGIDGALISTPGHSDDSISLIINNSCAFIGDLPAYSLYQEYNDLVLDDSWDMIQQYHVKTIYPGHGEPYVI